MKTSYNYFFILLLTINFLMLTSSCSKRYGFRKTIRTDYSRNDRKVEDIDKKSPKAEDKPVQEVTSGAPLNTPSTANYSLNSNLLNGSLNINDTLQMQESTISINKNYSPSLEPEIDDKNIKPIIPPTDSESKKKGDSESKNAIVSIILTLAAFLCFSSIFILPIISPLLISLVLFVLAIVYAGRSLNRDEELEWLAYLSLTLSVIGLVLALLLMFLIALTIAIFSGIGGS